MLVAAAGIYIAAIRRTPAVPTSRKLAFAAGWVVGAVALISPLCALSVALFCARVGQHMLLIGVSAPLIALGLPRAAARREPHPVAAAAALAAALWVWHAPAPYTATFQSDAAYWAMHVTTVGAAIWFWCELFGAGRAGLGGFALATLLTTGQMGLLGALITFAGRPLYPPHLLTTAAWGLSQLADQQLGGVLMWIPAGAIFAGGFVFAFVQVLRRAEARSPDPATA